MLLYHRIKDYNFVFSSLQDLHKCYNLLAFHCRLPPVVQTPDLRNANGINYEVTNSHNKLDRDFMVILLPGKFNSVPRYRNNGVIFVNSSTENIECRKKCFISGSLICKDIKNR